MGMVPFDHRLISGVFFRIIPGFDSLLLATVLDRQGSTIPSMMVDHTWPQMASSVLPAGDPCAAGSMGGAVMG